MSDKGDKNVITFEAIPGEEAGYYCALQIYRPGSFFTPNGEHAAFVGGCGIGHAKTLEDAKDLLLEGAKRYCQTHINDARATLAHYEAALRTLTEYGLHRCPVDDKGKPRMMELL